MGELLSKWRKQIADQKSEHEENKSRLHRISSNSSTGHLGLNSGADKSQRQDALEAYQLARMLVEYSYTCGSYDNISVIIVQLKE